MWGREVQVLPSPLSQLEMSIFPCACSRYPSPLPGLGSTGVSVGFALGEKGAQE